MKDRYEKMTNEDFNSILAELLIRDASTLLGIPGLYEVVSEHYNNEVLNLWEERNPAPETDEDEDTDDMYRSGGAPMPDGPAFIED